MTIQAKRERTFTTIPYIIDEVVEVSAMERCENRFLNMSADPLWVCPANLAIFGESTLFYRNFNKKNSANEEISSSASAPPRGATQHGHKYSAKYYNGTQRSATGTRLW